MNPDGVPEWWFLGPGTRLKPNSQEATEHVVLLRAEARRLRHFLTQIEAGYGHKLSAAELASIARAALNGAPGPS